MSKISKYFENRLLAGVFIAQVAILLVATSFTLPALALTTEQARAMAVGESDARIEALNQAVGDADEKTAAFIQALADDAVKVGANRLVVVKDGKSFDPVSGAEAPVPEGAEDVVNNNRMRSELDSALAALQLFSRKTLVRALAAQALAKEPDEAKLPLIEKALAAETDEKIKADLGRARAMVLLAAAEPAKRLEAAKALAASTDPGLQLLLNERISTETDPAVKAQLQATLRGINAGLRTGEVLAAMFTGLSLGSILLLAALGLAITYGLMGVINMAHGELIMIGAYATYVVQVLFRQYLPAAFDLYLLLAIPVAFAVSAAVGALMERSVIRFLYGRPLETLLATWGISLVLMQAVRSIFGAQNVGVENPSWMSGALQLLPNLSLPYNRMLIVVFAVLVLAGVALLISKTRLGLFVRGVTQNRAMASCMGVNTARVDTYAFALGSGVAGLAGCALSQVGNVGPDLGQNYIVDSFMVVVLGGVGQLAGTVYAALGLGVLNKFLEGWSGAVLAKIMVLAFIIIFIQKRPQGLFAMKGRSAEA
jgi:urea transport system permease protein